MNPSLLGAIVAALLAGLWLSSRRRPRPFLRSDDSSAVAALNRAQIAMVTVQAPASSPAAAAAVMEVSSHLPAAGSTPLLAAPAFPPAGAVRQRRALLLQLERWFHGSATDRRQAMALARLWGHPCMLPLLRRGLRDPDPLVMAEAAAAIQAFRGRSQGAALPYPFSPARLQASRPGPGSRPRKVLRTR